MPVLTRQLLDAAVQRQPYIKKYSIPSPDPANGETIDVWCRDMDSTDYTYLDLVDSLSNDEGKPFKWRQKHMGELVAVHSLCDETGTLLFEESTLKTDAWKKSYTGFKAACVAVARKHNGLQLGDIGADEKNSDGGGDGD